ncbi:MAG: 30S ribosomal protein S19 [Candidatus Korarchaeota archaeon]|nr:30S ribosomal protein S19 [Candidatus Korarchaeota archaeon]NIU84453.1 30S ribosomal protein S19 [Candidatus Thorarchaeota archaeon]NIW12936.1 30S ribosomal protein S19 [Candidatus Thorarchaeota archaeon]NIW51900.1 30S ribosomal protein S19 [Candidatus Korarchaeota archaeon]
MNDEEEWPPEWKKFTYKGYSLKELQEMTLEELSEVVPARLRRSLRRGLTPEQRRFLERLNKEEGPVRTHVRDMPILPNMVGRKIMVHNGNDFHPVEVIPGMIGHMLGEFAYTNKEVDHSRPGMGATRSSKFLSTKK